MALHQGFVELQTLQPLKFKLVCQCIQTQELIGTEFRFFGRVRKSKLIHDLGHVCIVSQTWIVLLKKLIIIKLHVILLHLINIIMTESQISLGSLRARKGSGQCLSLGAFAVDLETPQASVSSGLAHQKDHPLEL